MDGGRIHGFRQTALTSANTNSKEAIPWATNLSIAQWVGVFRRLDSDSILLNAFAMPDGFPVVQPYRMPSTGSREAALMAGYTVDRKQISTVQPLIIITSTAFKATGSVVRK